MGTLFLAESDVRQVLDMPGAIERVRECFRQLAAGRAENVPRHRASAPGAVLHTMSAAAGYLGMLGWKCYLTTKRGAQFHFGLYEQATGQLVALMQADRLGQIRTGATTGVAVDHLAHQHVDEMGLIGTGWQAEAQLTAVAAVRRVHKAYVYSRDPERRREFARQMQSKLAIEVAPVGQPHDAVEDLPVVITATTSAQPVLDGRWLAEGSLLCAMGSNWLGRAEIDVEAVRRADRIVCDSVECCRREAGDFTTAIELGVFDWSRAVELADVVAGRAMGQRNPAAVILFKSVGMALEDVAVATLVYERAKAQGLGREVDL